MNEFLAIVYRILKVLYFGLLVLSLVIFIWLAFESKPEETKVTETLKCYNGSTHTRSYFLDSELNEICGTELPNSITAINPATGREQVMDFRQYKLFYPELPFTVTAPEGFNQHSVTDNYAIYGSWSDVIKYSLYSIFWIAVVAEVVRRIFNYIFLKRNPFYIPEWLKQ